MYYIIIDRRISNENTTKAALRKQKSKTIFAQMIKYNHVDDIDIIYASVLNHQRFHGFDSSIFDLAFVGLILYWQIGEEKDNISMETECEWGGKK